MRPNYFMLILLIPFQLAAAHESIREALAYDVMNLVRALPDTAAAVEASGVPLPYHPCILVNILKSKIDFATLNFSTFSDRFYREEPQAAMELSGFYRQLAPLRARLSESCPDDALPSRPPVASTALAVIFRLRYIGLRTLEAESPTAYAQFQERYKHSLGALAQIERRNQAMQLANTQ